MISLLHAFRLPLAAAMLFACPLALEAADSARPLPSIVLAQSDPDAPVEDSQGAAGLLVRITRLEDQLRQMTGQIEQLQFQNKRLEDQLRKMQQDVDFRFQDLGRAPAGARPAAQKRGDLGDPDRTVPPVAAAAPDDIDNPLPAAPLVARPPRKTGDAFDPNTDPEAPGAPKPLGTTAASEPLPPRTATAPRAPAPNAALAEGTPHAPMDLMPNSSIRPTDSADAEPPAPRPAVALPAPGGADVASLVPGGTRGEYEADIAMLKGGQFDAAANGFQSFLQKYPKDKLVPEATYLLGESYARLGRHREAAEQFLKVSTDYTRSSRAPDALLHLGVALNALGAKEQACATYQEVDRKYPTASPDVRASVERELKRAKC